MHEGGIKYFVGDDTIHLVTTGDYKIRLQNYFYKRIIGIDTSFCVKELLIYNYPVPVHILTKFYVT